MHGPSVSISHVRGTSWLHRLDPVAKFAWVLPFGFFCFTTYWALPLFVSLVVALLIASTGQIIKPLAKIMIVFTPISASIILRPDTPITSLATDPSLMLAVSNTF